MRIISRSTLVQFWKRYPDAEQPLRAWFQEVESASWKGPVDVRPRYRSADFVAGNPPSGTFKDRRVVFNIRGNNYRLVVAVKYSPLFLVYVRFLGTHAEYDQIDATTV